MFFPLQCRELHSTEHRRIVHSWHLYKGLPSQFLPRRAKRYRSELSLSRHPISNGGRVLWWLHRRAPRPTRQRDQQAKFHGGNVSHYCNMRLIGFVMVIFSFLLSHSMSRSIKKTSFVGHDRSCTGLNSSIISDNMLSICFGESFIIKCLSSACIGFLAPRSIRRIRSVQIAPDHYSNFGGPHIMIWCQ